MTGSDARRTARGSVADAAVASGGRPARERAAAGATIETRPVPLPRQSGAVRQNGALVGLYTHAAVPPPRPVPTRTTIDRSARWRPDVRWVLPAPAPPPRLLR